MIKVFRAAIVLSIACFVVFSVLPLGPVRFEIDLPQRGMPTTAEQLRTLVGGLALTLSVLALMVTAVASIGLLLLRRWARPVAVVASLLAILGIATSFLLLPMPFAQLLSLSHAGLLAVSFLSWMAVLWLLRTPEIRARFTAG